MSRIALVNMRVANLHSILLVQQVIQEHNVEQEIIQAEDDFKIIEHADIAMDDNLGTFFCWS